MTGATISNEDVLAKFPDVPVDYDNIFHYRGLLDRKLMFNRCDRCGHWIYPHRPLCPECWSEEVTPTEVSGKGKVYFFTVSHQGVPVPGETFPFGVIAVELVEQDGLRYLTTIRGCPINEIRCDMPVELDWVDRAGTPAPVFRPVKEATQKQARK